MTTPVFRLGLIVNPYAGLGGSVGLKGSDGTETVEKALAMGAERRAMMRCTEALKPLKSYKDRLKIITCPGDMGENSVRELGFSHELIETLHPDRSTAEDTMRAAKNLKKVGVDLIMFAGGDGTARNVYDAIGASIVVLGIPAGVKMHSGVYAVTPNAAGRVVEMLIKGELVDLQEVEVKDIDENAFRRGIVKAKYYGELLVPREGHFLQNTKEGGKEVEELVLQDIAADIIEKMEDDELYIIGPGSTTKGIMDELGLADTLLGVDVIKEQQLMASDVTEQQLLNLIAEHSGPVKIIITAIGGQGHILGRGNQQLSRDVIKAVGKDHIIVVATKTKIKNLEGRPLLVDINDTDLERELSGYISVVTGYHDAIMYPVGISLKANV